MNNKINVLSLFDGMSCGQIALNKIGISNYNYFASEIKEDGIKVTQENFPNTIQVGDVTKLNKDNLPKIDLLIGGSPCQDFSMANKEKKGLVGEKSKLFFEYLRILKEVKPKYFLLENVKMSKDNQDIISKYLGVNPIFIDSKIVSGVMRKRLYWTNIPLVGELDDKGIKFQDILDSGYTNKEKGLCLLESLSRPLKNPVKIARRYVKFGFWSVIFKDKETYIKLKENFELATEEDVRYMNRNEMERAQTVPENYTSCVSVNNAAGLLGDGWTVDVIAHLFKGLLKDNSLGGTL